MGARKRLSRVEMNAQLRGALDSLFRAGAPVCLDNGRSRHTWPVAYCLWPISSSIDQDPECAGSGYPLRMWAFSGWSRGLTEIRRVHKEVVGFCVQAHGFGAKLCLDGFHLAEF